MAPRFGMLSISIWLLCKQEMRNTQRKEAEAVTNKWNQIIKKRHGETEAVQGLTETGTETRTRLLISPSSTSHCLWAPHALNLTRGWRRRYVFQLPRQTRRPWLTWTSLYCTWWSIKCRGVWEEAWWWVTPGRCSHLLVIPLLVTHTLIFCEVSHTYILWPQIWAQAVCDKWGQIKLIWRISDGQRPHHFFFISSWLIS